MKKLIALLMLSIVVPACADGLNEEVQPLTAGKAMTLKEYQKNKQPVIKKASKERTPLFYVAPRIGYEVTVIDKRDNPDGLAYGLALGTFLTDNVRVELEYFADKKVRMERRDHSKYAQKNYALNGYYDFGCKKSAIRPFLGLGAGMYQAKEYYPSDKDKKKNLMLSGQAGVSMALVDHVTFELMGRYRFLNNYHHKSNVEAIGGLRFDF